MSNLPTVVGNKFTTYLLYAIGEIFLVVIGILIAVSINNWNNSRKEQIVLTKKLDALRNELINEREELSRVKDLHTFRYFAIKSLFDLIDEPFSISDPGTVTMTEEIEMFEDFWLWKGPIPETYDSSFVCLTLAWVHRYYPFESSKMVISELSMSGQLSSLTNELLKEQIKNYYSSIDFRFKYQNNFAMDRWNESLHEQGIFPIQPCLKEDPLSIFQDNPQRLSLLRDICINAKWLAGGATRSLEFLNAAILELEREIEE